MLRSRHIPSLLSRICTDGIDTALLVTMDGELLGRGHAALPDDVVVDDDVDEHGASSSSSSLPPSFLSSVDASDAGALVAEVAGDYRRAGRELSLLGPLSSSLGSAAASASSSSASTDRSGRRPPAPPTFFLLESERGSIGIADAGEFWTVVAVAREGTDVGLLRARTIALAGHVREAFEQLTSSDDDGDAGGGGGGEGGKASTNGDPIGNNAVVGGGGMVMDDRMMQG